jgi:threonine dehydrogenase-like Zn-dependent dehydrogenase
MEGKGVVRCVDAPDPELGPGEVIVATRVSALCGSELHAYREHGRAQGNLGHEAAGVVAELGEGVTALRVGQRVGVSAVSGCGKCEYCARGQNTWCPDRSEYTNMHAEKFVVAANGCHVLPSDVPWQVGVLITGDGLGVPYHTSTKLQDGSIGNVAVFGVGPIGLGSVILQTYLGRKVIAVDIAPRRLQLATSLGAVHTIDPGQTDDVVRDIQALTGGKGADVCIEAAGRPETARWCFAAVRTAGTVVFNGEQPGLDLSPSRDFIRRDITAVGSFFYQVGEFAGVLALYRTGLPIERLVTHCFPLAEASDAYRQMAAGLTGKVLLVYEP